MASRLDKPANAAGLTRLPLMEEIGGEGDGPFNRLVLLLALDHEITVIDEAAVLKFSRRELREAEDWLYFRHLAASDNIVRRKRLEQPVCTLGVLGRNPL